MLSLPDERQIFRRVNVDERLIRRIETSEFLLLDEPDLDPGVEIDDLRIFPLHDRLNRSQAALRIDRVQRLESILRSRDDSLITIDLACQILDQGFL